MRESKPCDGSVAFAPVDAHVYRVFAVILNWNNPNDTIACVGSLRATSPALADIVVVDNGSDADLFEPLVDSLEGTVVLRNDENLGYAGGLQAGVDYCLGHEADLIWLLNNDTSFTDTTLTELLACVGRNGLNSIYAPQLLFKSHPDRVLFNGRFFHFPTAGYQNADRDGTYTYGRGDSDLITEAVSGASFLVPADIIRRHGFMSHDYFLYYEEFDYALRMKELGIRCICAQSSVMFHEREGTTGRNRTTLSRVRGYYRTRNRILFFRRRFPTGAALKCTLTVIRQVWRNLGREDARGKRTQLLAVWHGLIGRSGKVLIP